MPREEPNNVIRMAFDGTVITTGRSDKPYCHHRSVVVDDNARIVTCRVCGATLDPIAVLLMYAREGDALRRMLKEKKKLEKQLIELKDEEKRAKARKRSRERREG
jgi:hypothetical protein